MESRVFPYRWLGPFGTLEVDAVIDTGFNGECTLPREPIDTLGLTEATVTEVTLGKGRVRGGPLYEANALLAGVTQDIFVAEAPTTPLIGTGLLRGFSLYVGFQPNGVVELERLPDSSA